MLQMLQKRIHIINLGFETGWILSSFKKSKPDKVFLISKEQDKNIAAEKKIKQFLEE